MGEMADWILDQLMDDEDDRFLYRMGGMSHAEAYDSGIIDELGWYSHQPMVLGKPAMKTCKHCGKTGLHWKDTGSGWRLATADDELHTCAQHKF